MSQPDRHRLQVHVFVLLAAAGLLSACSDGVDGPVLGDAGHSAQGGWVESTGGVNTAGGVVAGGSTSTGGSSSGGGNATGGVVSGGTSAGGAAMGGAITTGGSSIGGTSSSGSSTGGASTGGAKAIGAAISTGRTASSTGGAVSSKGSSTCPSVGHVTYTLAKVAAPTTDQKTAYDRITAAMDTAIRYYNCYTNITKVLNVSYVPSVATADGNTNGSIRFGSTASMNRVTAMHEISHTVGIGTASNWSSFVVSGKFTGQKALAQLLAIPNRLADTMGADGMHFWPYGLNYETEGRNESDLIGHCQMVVAIRKDLGR